MAIHSVKVALRGNPFYYALAANNPSQWKKFIKKEKAYHIKKAQKFPDDDEKENSKKRKDESQKQRNQEEGKKRPVEWQIPHVYTVH
ncbi:uncharacterized protein G2W53_044950 [Senna tora]|uniref:Uncharacterized protein n=1 Tax=Senna tora TaxID=362788 RepID=A0A834SD51_9FABA|nr:uncharacterized protein G2W53_044950 [Senna tora]